LRRTAPVATARRFEKRYVRDTSQYDARLVEAEERKLAAARETKIDVGQLDRVDEMQSTWQSGSDELLTLKAGFGGTVAKMEKAKAAVDVAEEG